MKSFCFSFAFNFIIAHFAKKDSVKEDRVEIRLENLA
jgi:hypothetical protein